MAYDFRALSSADFEDLSRDIIGKELGVRFEAFAAGPDGGLDGRHASAAGDIVLQAKHFAGSAFAQLKTAMNRERVSIDLLAPARYILSTSRPLSPTNKRVLAGVIGPSLCTEADIVGPGDLNALLRKYPDVEKSHIKLWLTSSAVLERVLRAASKQFNAITREEIDEKLRVYAPNPSFDQARSVLDKQHVLIISGPPGVGKTTLAEMLSYAHLAEDWSLIAIRGLDDGLQEIDDRKKQIFYFDDFLGRVALDKHALSRMDSDLARFINRVQKSPNARFILTTRAPIFEEARRHSEHLADKRVEISRYLLDVGVYTRRIKARILYNHLLVTGTPQAHVNALVESGKIPKIVDHANYSPRIVALMTEGMRVDEIAPETYPDAFLGALNNPQQLWDIPFRNHIPRMCQNLLLTLFFCNEFGVKISELQSAFEAFHEVLSDHFRTSRSPKDFEDSLRMLEGGFIKITGLGVSFLNPSVRDYLSSYLNDLALLKLAARASADTGWAQAVWDHQARGNASENERAELAHSFLNIAEGLVSLPTTQRRQEGVQIFISSVGLSNTERIELLLDWWQATGERRYAELAKEVAARPVDGFDSWRDGKSLIALVAKIRNGDHFPDLPGTDLLAEYLEEGVLDMLRGWPNSEDLENLSDAVEEWHGYIGDKIPAAIDDAIKLEISEVDQIVRQIDSELTIDDHVAALRKLGKRARLPHLTIENAVQIALERKSQIEESTSVASSPRGSGAGLQDRDIFDDTALKNLFDPLVKR